MQRDLSKATGLFFAGILAVTWPFHAVAEEAVFVEKGEPRLVVAEGKAWRPGPGYLECSGTGNILYAGKALGAGDVSIRARLTLIGLGHTAASFTIGADSHFGFDGAGDRPFVEGPALGGKTRFVADAGAVVAEGKPFDFEVLRRGTKLSFLINGEAVHATEDRRERFGSLGLRPWRATMRVHEFRASGELRDLPMRSTMPVSYSIPIVDLSTETWRQVIVERTLGQYLGHPTTVLLADRKTILCVYPLGHGGPAAVMKRSTDGGLTWSERLRVPDNWKTATNCPCIHRLTGPDGVERLFVLEGNGDMRQAVSTDGGATWTPFEKNGLQCVVAPITIVPISENRHLALYHRGSRVRDRSSPEIWQSISGDGGRTWGPQRMVCAVEGADPCEPAVVRSPDGKQLLCLMRENSRRLNSLMMVSDDEGETWSEPLELPASLTGDRHLPRYAPDGRLVVPFRDMAKGSPTYGDFVAWVGTYDDIVGRREGQYRVRLINSPVKRDLGYPGLELLPDGTFVATTYAVLAPGEKHSVVSVRFRLDEIDTIAAALPRKSRPFVSGTEGYHTFRIPAVIVTKKGTVLAFSEGRKRSRSDTGDINTVLRRSFDGGKTWGPLQVIWDDGENTCGNPCPVVDRTTGTVWLLLTHNLGVDRESEIIAGKSRGTRTVWVTSSGDDGATWSKPREITASTKRPDWTWYATGPGVGIQLELGRHKGRLIIPCDHIEAGSKRYYSHVIYSDDHGKTWNLGGRTPRDQVNECQVVELADGRLMLNMRNYDRTKTSRAISVSDDGGMTWSDLRWDETLVEPICQASFLRYTRGPAGDRNRVLFSNPARAKAGDRNDMTVRLSYDEGRTWPVSKLLHLGPSAYSCLTVLSDGSIGCLYEGGTGHPYETITFARLTLGWLTGGKDRIRDAEESAGAPAPAEGHARALSPGAASRASPSRSTAGRRR